MRQQTFLPIWAMLLLFCTSLTAQTTVTILTSETHQTIDGFGAFQGGNAVNQSWWQELFFDDMQASIYRVDLTPQLVSPYSDLRVYSPWFMGSQVKSVFNLEDPANPNGPEGNRVRTYTGPDDYSRDFGGMNAPIAVMGPDIEANIRYFSYSRNDAITSGAVRKDELGDFKLIGSIWSPLPWVKVSSGNTYPQNSWPGPVMGSPWPFIWGGNYAGGRLDVTDTPLAVFDDSALGGSGPTSSLTQLARSTAAYVKGYQDYYGVEFYAISLQNELNFEQFYNSCTYRLSSQYIAALKAVRAEFDRYPELRDIRIMGPEDLLGGDYALWQYGGNNDPTHKNLQYLQNIGNDPVAEAAIDFFCIHGYDTDGVSAGAANPVFWQRWKDGWSQSPAPGIPADVKGYADYGKKSWMTETSGEMSDWISPSSGFPSFGGWSVGLRIHQALTAGDQSAWIYWTFAEEDNTGKVTPYGLTGPTQGTNAPKYVAAKHFFNPIRPGAVRVTATADPGSNILAGAYFHEANKTLTVVALNASADPESFRLELPDYDMEDHSARTFLSHENAYWQSDSLIVRQGVSGPVVMPGYSIVSIVIDLEKGTTGSFALNNDPGITGLHVYPNPSRGNSTLTFALDEAADLELQLYSPDGKMVRPIFRGRTEAGKHQLPLDQTGIPPGTYFLQLSTDHGSVLTKWIIQAH